MTPKEKATAGLWLLKQAIIDLLSRSENRGGMRPFQIRDALGLLSDEEEGHGMTTGLLKLMTANRELETIGDYQPLYAIPGNHDGE